MPRLLPRRRWGRRPQKPQGKKPTEVQAQHWRPLGANAQWERASEWLDAALTLAVERRAVRVEPRVWKRAATAGRPQVGVAKALGVAEGKPEEQASLLGSGKWGRMEPGRGHRSVGREPRDDAAAARSRASSRSLVCRPSRQAAAPARRPRSMPPLAHPGASHPPVELAVGQVVAHVVAPWGCEKVWVRGE
jgi:hypothetical protein